MIDVKPADEERKPMLKLITGGKGEPPATGVNWLGELQKNAAFSCKKKGTVDYLELYVIAFKHTKTMILVDGLNNNNRFAVDPEDFCKKYSLFEIIEEGGEHPEAGKDEPDSTRTLRSSDVEDNVDAEGG